MKMKLRNRTEREELRKENTLRLIITIIIVTTETIKGRA